MERSSSDGVQEFSSPPQILVLVGRMGTGKSATGNSILGTSLFKSERSSSGVTITCELQSTQLQEGRIVNVIDTPGVFGSAGDHIESTAKEIINCMNMAGDGIHAFLFVFSIRNRFSKEEEAAISRLEKVFGRLIFDYMILVFTGGDQLDEDGETLEDFLLDCPEKLKELVIMCENRYVPFNNKTEDQTKRFEQLEKLFTFVNVVSRKNDGKVYKNIFTELKKESGEFEEQVENFQAMGETKKYADYGVMMQLDPMQEGQFDTVELKLKENALCLEQQIEEERAARLKAEQTYQMVMNSRKSQSKLDQIKKFICAIL